MKKSLSLALFLLSSSSLLQAKGGLEKLLGGPEEDLHLSLTRAIKKQKSRALDMFSGTPLLQELKKQYEIQVVALENIRTHSLMSSSSSKDLSSSTEDELKSAYNKARSEIKQLKNRFGPEARLQLITSFASLPIEGAPAESVKYGIALKDTSVSALAKFQSEFDSHDYHQFIEWKNYATYLTNAALDLKENGQNEKAREYNKAAFRIYEKILPVVNNAIELLRTKKLSARASNVRSKTTGELGVILTTDELLEGAYYDAGNLALILSHTETALNFLLSSQKLARINTIDREYLPYLIAYAWHNLGVEKNNPKYLRLAVAFYDEYFQSYPKIISLDDYIKAADAALSTEQTVVAELWMRKVVDTLKVTGESDKLKFKPTFRINAQKLGTTAYKAEDYSTALYFYESIVQNKAILDQPGLNPSMQYYNAGSMAYLAKEDEKARSYFSHVNRQDPLVTPMMCEGMDVWLQEITARESGRELRKDSYSSSSSEDESEEDEEKEVKKDHQYYFAKLSPEGRAIYSEVSQLEDIESSFNVGLYFDLSKISECEKAIKAISTIQKLLMANVEALFKVIIDQIEEQQEFLDSEVLAKHVTSADILTNFMNKIIKGADKSELTKEILSSYIEEVPENEKSIALGIAKNLLKALKLKVLKERISQDIERLTEDDQMSQYGTPVLPSSLSVIQNNNASTSSPAPVAQEELPFIFNPSFKGASPSGAVPQGYTLTSDPAQKRGTKVPLSVAPRGEGHVALRGDGYVFYHRLPTDVMKRLDKKSFAFEVDVLSNTPGAYIQYWGYRDQTSKKLQSTAHTGSGEWEKLRLNFTVDGSASQFFLYPAIMPGVELGSTIPEVEIKGVSLREIDQSLPVAFDLREIDRSLPITFNPSFKGASPSGAVPQGYTLVPDPAQKRGTKVPLSVALRGEGHVALTGDGYVFYYQLSKGELAQLAGQKVSFEADIRSDTAGAYIQYWDYPNSQKTQSARYDGKGEWETLRLDFTINPQQTMFFLYPAIMPGVKEGSSAPVIEVRNVRLR